VPLTHQPGGPPAGGQVHGLREAVAAAQRAGKRAVVATPRVLKPGEDGLAAFYLRLGADALLLRSAGLLHRLTRPGGPGARPGLSLLSAITCVSVCYRG
jgi:hypothetical protein